MYQRFLVPDSEYKRLTRLRFFQDKLDAYCIDCRRESIFSNVANYVNYTKEEALRQGSFFVELECYRDRSHRMMFLFLFQARELSKIGQSPSLADLEIVELDQFRSVLNPEQRRELARGIGLAAHGVGIGAFVYLRRIFEQLVEEAHGTAKSESEWNEEEYQQGRMQEKINLLKDHLPAFLVENSFVYSVLSKGIHSLSEQECLAHFDVLRTGILLILTDRRDALERVRRRIEAEKSLAKLRQNP
jgi:hypothetical protein